MSTPLDIRFRRRARTVRLLSLGIVVAASAGLVGLSPLAGQSAGAVENGASKFDISWADPSQPERKITSPHYQDFKDLKVSVSQTSGLVDQAILISVEGLGVGVGTEASTSNQEPRVDSARNFVQAMQCWGDPGALDFRETCQWGGRYVVNGINAPVVTDNAMRVPAIHIDSEGAGAIDNPFRTVQGVKVPGKNVTVQSERKYPILDFFNSATTNEVLGARVGSTGKGSFGFEVQTSDQAPQLGCGSEGKLRCWLVVVPRGSHFGGNGSECSGGGSSNGEVEYTYGEARAVQGGSPISPTCDYWDNRLVIPLDFLPTGRTCAIGSSEQKVVGSQLMVAAMSSWQPDLCTRLKTTYNFATNPDSVARQQLLDGRASIGYTGVALSAGEVLTNEDRQLLADTKLTYAPVAISGVSISFLAESSNGVQTELRISPRLMAKFLTQSYSFQVPAGNDAPGVATAHLAAVTPSQSNPTGSPYRYVYEDPEFRELNPTNYQQYAINPGVILPGPSGADAIRQVWRWILADAKAVAFLSGNPDEGGMKVNPYYLPIGHPDAKVPTFTEAGEFVVADGQRVMKPVGLANIDGSPLEISRSLQDTFPKSDGSLAPRRLTVESYRFDSIQFAPYSDNLLSSARTAFRADPRSRSYWDPNAINPGASNPGNWVNSGAQLPGSRFMIAISDTPSTLRYGLSSAALQLPNSTEFAKPDNASMAGALSALTPTSVESVKQVDPARISGTAYPLTMVTYAVTNLTVSDAEDRAAASQLITQVTTTGQAQGTEPGQLPQGYLPLTAAMRAEAAASVNVIRSYVPPVRAAGGTTTSSNGPAQDSFEAPSLPLLNDQPEAAAAEPSAAEVTPGVDAAADSRTEQSDVAVLTRGGLAASLGVGLLGSIFGPLLFRGRGIA